VVIEHHPDVMLAADYIVDLGPEGGPRGGSVIASGSPEAIAAIAESHTGQAIREALRLVLPPSSPPALPSFAEGA
jgi:excinuclease ABC subunit A